MKRFGAYFFAIGLMLGSLLLQYDPALAWGTDTNAHYGDANCIAHIPSIIGTPYTFTVCQANSQATSWQIQILDANNNLVAGCTQNPSPPVPPFTFLPPLKMQITCNNLPAGQLKAKVLWYVGTSLQMQHTDTPYRR